MNKKAVATVAEAGNLSDGDKEKASAPEAEGESDDTSTAGQAQK